MAPQAMDKQYLFNSNVKCVRPIAVACTSFPIPKTDNIFLDIKGIFIKSDRNFIESVQ